VIGSFDQLDRGAQLLLLGVGLSIVVVFLVLGRLIKRHRRYELIAGYNTSPRHVQEQYDIEGLASHIGDGLVTLSVLLFIGLAFLYFDLHRWFYGFMGLFLFVVLIMVIGTSKFMPERQELQKRSPSDAKHYHLYRMLPRNIYRALEKGTRQWAQVCHSCSHVQDYWEAGGVRYKAAGKKSQLGFCEKCGKMRMQKLRRKKDLRS